MEIENKQANLYAQDVWDTGYSNLQFAMANESDPVTQFLATHSKLTQGSCLEVGCFPGRYLAVLGELGFELNGIDLTPRIHPEMTQWLKSRGYRLGDFSREDFLNSVVRQRYDLVYSLGFIEHFTNWKEVLRAHARLVKPGGRILISTPNFSGVVQKFLHRIFDKQNLDRHFLPSMNPKAWENELLSMGFKTEFGGYFGGFDFWVGEQKRSVLSRTGLAVFSRILLPIIRMIVRVNSKHWSPHCGIVVLKIKES
ncbi:MAG: class I SAM-dependent methyltransferase [Oligoflexia bacterium]|nr:class I SAM-dependent methyltransferase [Oligoflexia bacterium]